MGLDQYIMVSEDMPETRVDFTASEYSYQLYYFRKHNALHGWMERLYRSLGGIRECNMSPVQLTLEDLDQLEKDTATWSGAEGFFFGADSSKDLAQLADTKEMIELARAELIGGNAVFYTAWY